MKFYCTRCATEVEGAVASKCLRGGDHNFVPVPPLAVPLGGADLEELRAIKDALTGLKRAFEEGQQKPPKVKCKSLSSIGKTEVDALKKHFQIDGVVSVDRFPFDLPPGESGFGSVEQFLWPCGEDRSATERFCSRLSEPLIEKTGFALLNVHTRALFSKFYLQVSDTDTVVISGKTDLVVLRAVDTRGSPSNDQICKSIHAVIELKTDQTIRASTGQIVGKLIFAAFESHVSSVYGVVTTGNSWEYLWFNRRDGKLIVERFVTEGWINGVRHLCALLLAPVSESRVFPQCRSGRSDRCSAGGNGGEGEEESSGNSRINENDDAEEGADNNDARNDQEGAIDDELDAMPDWFDADGSQSLGDDQMVQKFLFATRKLPMFADLQRFTLTEESIRHINNVPVINPVTSTQSNQRIQRQKSAVVN